MRLTQVIARDFGAPEKKKSVPKVHILATCRNPELLPATLMVFKTIRVGFSTAEVTVWWNGDMDVTCKTRSQVYAAAAGALGGLHWWDGRTIHHEWILRLLDTETEPFYICDTDVVFWESVEGWNHGDAPIAGRYTPQFFDHFTKCVTRPRLHTCLMYFNPGIIRQLAEKYLTQFSDTQFQPRPNLIYPMFHPVRQGSDIRNYFYDTTSMLFHAIGGRLFDERQNLAFDHLQYGTFSDLVAGKYPNGNIVEFHAAVLDNPKLLKGQWKRDLEYYRQRYAE